MSDSTNHDCHMCGLEDSDDATVVFRDDLWSGQTVPGYDVPGWFVLRVRRHAERLTGLSDAELETFGRRARDLTAAVGEVTGAPATYLLAFGENHRHFHVLVIARTEDVPDDRRNGDILKLRSERSEPEEAARLVPAVRSAYQRLAESGAQVTVGG
ncbi:hypothetical protein [Streptomyces sp. NPDC102360]|uniref:hypothetical protein n=1 Tax=Streptomyces sp. NPDC102360 TaxID=3366160 RepID=UPI003810EC62